VKDLLTSDSICQSYAQMKKGPVFLTRSVETALARAHLPPTTVFRRLNSSKPRVAAATGGE